VGHSVGGRGKAGGEGKGLETPLKVPGEGAIVKDHLSSSGGGSGLGVHSQDGLEGFGDDDDDDSWDDDDDCDDNDDLDDDDLDDDWDDSYGEV
jgi:hypothetical protein